MRKIGTKFGEGQRLSTSFAMISMRKVLAQSTGLVGMSYAQAVLYATSQKNFLL